MRCAALGRTAATRAELSIPGNCCTNQQPVCSQRAQSCRLRSQVHAAATCASWPHWLPSLLAQLPCSVGLFRPTLPAGAIGPMLGALGALVMPYNLVRLWLRQQHLHAYTMHLWSCKPELGRLSWCSSAGAMHKATANPFLPTLPLADPCPPCHPCPLPQYFHSAVVGSRRPEPPTPGQLRGVLRYLRIETPVVLLGAFFINLTVICVFAQGFYGTGELPGCWQL